MLLIAGLGNPGIRYKRTWHNLGFITLDTIYKRHKGTVSKFSDSKKFYAEISEGEIFGKKVLLAKPKTYMNLSGKSIQAIKNFYSLPTENIYIIHDELDLDLGRVKISEGSAEAGHNGVRSITQSLGSKNFLRIRLGIRTDVLDKIKPEKYVLMKVGLKNVKSVSDVVEKACSAVEHIIQKGPQSGKNIYNQK